MADAWGENNWGEGFWGQQSSITVSVTGIEVESSIGTESVLAGATATPTGISAPTEVGQAIGEPESIYPVTGIQSNTATGTLEAQEGHGVTPTGVEINFALDTENQTFDVVGDAALSTAQFKFGGSSLELDGSGDYIKSNRDYTLGLGDFTFETFARFDVLSGFQYIWDASENVGTNDSPIIYITASNIIFKFGGGAAQIDVAHGMSINTWHHIAVTRDGRDYEVFIDGSSVGTATDSQDQDIPSTFYTIGASASGGLGVNGYIDETRISTSVRYTSDFAVPTSEFVSDSNTLILLHFDGANGSTDILDSATPFVVATVDAGWGRGAWGSFAWNNNIEIFANVVGESMSTFTGTVSVNTGEGVVVSPTGLGVGTEIGNFTLITDNIIDVTGLPITVPLANPTILADGNVTTSAPGDQMDFAIGEVEIVASHIEEVTGQELSTSLANVTIESRYTVSGVSMQFADGETTETGSAIVTPTGIEMSVVVGNMRSTPWANVVTGASNTWTPVAA